MKVCGDGALYVDRFFGERMSEFESSGGEHEADEIVTFSEDQVECVVAVAGVSDDWVVDVVEVATELVTSSRLRV